MQLNTGEKIKLLRKEKNISQEVLAQYLGVTFQAVSKWETGAALPDVATIPAIALFFGVSTDQLFDLHLLEYDACRILAETHRARGEYDLAKLVLEKIPEIYFSKLQLQALLLEGGDMYAPAWEQKELATETLADMYLRLAPAYC